jgi:hypothetical protein
MSEIKVDTLTGKTTANDITVTAGATATMSLEQGLAKCWIRFNGTGTISTDDSFNVSGILDVGTGQYDVQILNDMANDDYAYYGFSSRDASTSQVGMFGSTNTADVTTAKFRVIELAGTTFFDVGVVMCAVHGDLA